MFCYGVANSSIHRNEMNFFTEETNTPWTDTPVKRKADGDFS